MTTFQKNDIVRLTESKFKDVSEQLWFKDNTFAVYNLIPEGKVKLWELDTEVSTDDLLPIAVSDRQYRNIYYDPVIAASFVGQDGATPVHNTDYTFFRDAFKKVSFEDGTTLADKANTGGQIQKVLVLT